jgi:diguanylate cyclase (GGDEF)-like protein
MGEEVDSKKDKYTQNLRLIGTVIAVLFWWYDAYVDTYIFLDGEFIDNMFRPEAKQIWLRFAVMASLIGLSFYSHKMLHRVKRAEKLKDLFVSTVSHELRTPLTSIIGSLDIIGSGMAGEVSEESKKMVQIAHKNSNRLLELINDILDLQKLESGLMTYELAPMPAGPFVDEVVEAMEGFADQYNVKIRADNNAPEAIVQGDKSRLTQVLTNLAANAVRYSPPGEEVVIKISQSGSLVRFAVIDKGPGVPHKFKNRIFSEFAQAESGSLYGKGGTGLGLNISKRIVERHEGKISFISDPGRSTSFYFDIPEFRGALASVAPTGKAAIDSETGVFNWSYFEGELEKEWGRATRAETALTIIFLEVPKLETYFDKYGEVAGREALIKIAKAFSGLIKRPGDVLARNTSNRFAVLLPDTNHKGAAILAEEMRSVVLLMDIEFKDDEGESSSKGKLAVLTGAYTIIPDRLSKSESLVKGAEDALNESIRSEEK